MQYHDYLQSDAWKFKRKQRLFMDRNCAICGRPFDLEVHHMTYLNTPYEDPGDLITVCRNCHQRIEDEKRNPGDDSFIIVRNLMIEQFIIENQNRDYSQNGNIDFCDLDTVKMYLFPYLKQHGLDSSYCMSGASRVIHYFRNRRYEVILRYLDNGADQSIVAQQTRFSNRMIQKVYRNPQTARRLIKDEEVII